MKIVIFGLLVLAVMRFFPNLGGELRVDGPMGWKRKFIRTLVIDLVLIYLNLSVTGHFGYGENKGLYFFFYEFVLLTLFTLASLFLYLSKDEERCRVFVNLLTVLVAFLTLFGTIIGGSIAGTQFGLLLPTTLGGIDV